MRKEYLILHLSSDEEEKLDAMLNDYFQDGWHLISHSCCANGFNWRYTFLIERDSRAISR